MSEAVRPSCPECRDTGFVIVEAGVSSRARRCVCRSADRPAGIGAVLAAARVPARYRECDFENFAAGYGSDPNQTLSLEAAKAVARRYADEYPLNDRGLLFMGPPGVGKTHLAVATLRRLMVDKGVPGLFCDVQELLRQLQGTFDRPGGAGEIDILHPVLTTEVVLLDDLGGRQFSPWVEETLAHVVTVRYNERRATLVTTNYVDDPPDPRAPTLRDRIGPRVRSRLYEMCHLVRVQAQDFRQTISRADHHPVAGSRRAARPRS
jgi:DNA replication protein DnaC